MRCRLYPERFHSSIFKGLDGHPTPDTAPPSPAAGRTPAAGSPNARSERYHSRWNGPRNDSASGGLPCGSREARRIWRLPHRCPALDTGEQCTGAAALGAADGRHRIPRSL
ncbi:hypothetical protein GH5_01580 [Leishmania sp. Ghana 2012 LV757]|uniref:hypothetical protein n=1 Tax=Leishmania sp. Ghana 2012 LV757 TaxID=2803181 RepID=UPI001B666F67|nr:hypothetical protein GH5_01580 [Leishmania sp. Ghana 2012 LV757]